MATDYLEDDLREPYEAWKGAPGPESNAAMLGALRPHIEGAIHAHVGGNNPLLYSRARRMALGAVRSYDPTRSRLRTHLFNQLQGLKRVNREQTGILRVPERVRLEGHFLRGQEQELHDTLGREPTDDELADHTGLASQRIRRARRAMMPAVAEGTLESGPAGGVYGGVKAPGADQRLAAARDLVSADLSASDRFIMDQTLAGRPGQEVARKLSRSPGLVSQRKKFIQQQIDAALDSGLL